ncbi:MAG: hypothetical protein ACK5U2_01950, partial [Microcystis sp.]
MQVKRRLAYIMAIIYVKSGSTGNGSAWNNAYGSLASALTAAQAVMVTIYIKSGSTALDAGDYKLFSSLRNALAFRIITFFLTIFGGNNFALAVSLYVNAQSNIYGGG